MRILFRGGSIPASKGVDKGYVEIVEEYTYSNGNEIINRSRIGETTFDGIWSFNEDIDSIQPEILVLHFGIDDAYYPVYRSEFKENLVQIVKLSRKRFNPEIVLLTSHPFENEYEMNTMEIYYRAIREVAQDLQCNLIPIHMVWINYLYQKGIQIFHLLQDDVRYPNQRGHMIYAEAVLNKLNSIMNKSVSST